MTPIEAQVLDTWNIHHRITQLLIGSISDEALKATLSTRGGRDLGRQLAHVNNVRCAWIESFAKKTGIALTVFDTDESPSQKKLFAAFNRSGEAMAKFIEHALANGGEVKGFKRGIVPMIGYLISHEAHHRGHALLTMKQAGFKIADPLKWGIWDWAKI